ncbi:MAG: tripartite tricarboxylate transporter substrate binding protein [Burkholderiales bacterium]|nr:tripartite tricarboxylate transporter substrate binding protein [Burkholderiales bacterium]
MIFRRFRRSLTLVAPACLALSALLGLCPAPASAWTPIRPVRVLVPLAPGSNLDNQARLLALGMSRVLGTSVVVENRPGGGTLIAAREVARAAPDGYTLLFNVAVMTTMPHLYKEAPFDLFRDFTPITPASLGGTVLVTRPDTPYRNVADVAAAAKANPGGVMIASYGIGTPSHLNIEVLKSLIGVDIGHVPYAGGSTPANIDLMGGRIDLYFDGPATAIPNMKAGKVRILGAASEQRIPAIPDVPTFREQGFEVGTDGWLAFFGPGGMPADIVSTLHRAIVEAMKSPEFRKAVLDAGLDFGGESPVSFQRRLERDYRRWGEIIRKAGIRLD